MKTARGFTLIELLIVIALLGALAIGLLATIDPFEQLKKGRDTSTRNTVSEFYNANLRYYSTKSDWPWTSLGSATPLADPIMSDAATGAITKLINAGELKAGFTGYVGAGTLSTIYVSSTGLGDLHVCYMPESKGFQIDANTIYDPSGGTSITTCKATGGTDPCYYCIQ